MLKNYLNTAIRNVKRNPFISIISILGLSIGMAYAFLAFLYIQYETDFDTFHKKADVICRVVKQRINAINENSYRAQCGADIGPLFQKTYSEIVNFVRFTHQEGILTFRTKRYFEENLVYFTDSSVFDMFSFTLNRGAPASALTQPGTAVITHDFAEKYFGDEDPIGKKVNFQNPLMKNHVEIVITGILDPIPQNSHLQFGLLVSFSTLSSVYISGYLNNDFSTFTYTYFEITSPHIFKGLQNKIKNHRLLQFQNDRTLKQIKLEKLRDIYLSSKALPGNGEKRGNDSTITFFYFSFIFILLISCANVINLLTARTSGRGKEATIRKITGATRSAIIYQFIIESLVLSVLSLLGALILVEISLPFFNIMIERKLVIDYLFNPGYITFIIGITFITGVLSGLYPALFFSAAQPTTLLKTRRNRFTKIIRKIIVVTQFIISISLFICSAVISEESEFLKTKDPGFIEENILFLNMNAPQTKDKYSLFKSKLLAENVIESVTASSLIPWSIHQMGKKDIGSADYKGFTSACLMFVDEDFLKTYSIELLEGADFSHTNTHRIANTYLINETAKKTFGWDIATGKRLDIRDLSYKEAIEYGTIQGVMKDFHFEHPIYKIQPLILIYAGQKSGLIWNFVSIRVKENMKEESISIVKEIWETLYPEVPFRYSFLNTRLETVHSTLIDVINTVLKFATVFAIFIACLGLMSLSFHESEQRSQELGIRKALGAVSFEIILTLMKNMVLLVVLANIIAWPLTIGILKGLFLFFQYPFPFEFRPGIFFLSSAGSFTLALITVSGIAFRTSKIIPSDTLRYE